MAKDTKLDRALGAHTLVALDTNVFIYHFEDHPSFRGLTYSLFEAIETGMCKAVTSVLTRLEILVMPLKANRPDIADSSRFLLDTFPNLTQVPMGGEVADLAAILRATHGLATPDSIHLASAQISGATLLITNDGDFSEEKAGMEVLLLDSLL